MRVLIAIDQLFNTVFAGWPDETLSARAYRMNLKDRVKLRWVVAMIVIDGLFFWDQQHCKESYHSERLRRQLPPEYRDPL
jgi:hypothetical protein